LHFLPKGCAKKVQSMGRATECAFEEVPTPLGLARWTPGACRRGRMGVSWLAAVGTRSRPIPRWRAAEENRGDISANKGEELNTAGRAASRHAYCPYSRFAVGAAVLTEAGDVFIGCNVENASYGLTVCAERSAIFQMVARGGGRLRAIVIYTPTQAPVAPC